ncbi:MAG: tRNA (adenosine(37)-N6)-threonylcarbamoyltransferase complex transferase subunit TsaD [Ignavibacteriae bacterium]|nr:MAG: tRNA (adenosine(37)-N6)-threonylcarbamoyltransferase complex transferase subunit TsaD [Ignavibacteriota bacterium]
MNVLGIESSCDETSSAILSDNKILSNLISSQDFHADYGGVVPELSSRAHMQIVKPLVDKSLKESNLKLGDIDLIAVTAGPGLIGALLVGLTYAKGLAFSLNKPFIAVNHIEGHIYSGFLMEEKPEFPILSLVVSGGHTLLLYVKSFTEIQQLGTTVDDAAGEAFDKVSKMLSFGYPGGPKIQNASKVGDENKIKFPVAELKNPYNFSFSGLKTSVLRYIQKNFSDVKNIPEKEINNIAASFQKAVVNALMQNTERALNNYDVKSISLVGGVAANAKLRNEIMLLSKRYDKKIIIPSFEFCGDNAAMIAFRGKTLFEAGRQDSLNVKPYPSLGENYFHAG